jgi:EAL domain-containing protein (putative c-di-GMP-specific phosphodiesterase class I)
VRDSDTVGRLGGDEFIVLLEDLGAVANEAAARAEAIAEKIMATLSQPYSLTGHLHRSSSSIGITLFDEHDVAIEDLLKRADVAMYRAKACGRNTVRFFDQQMQSVILARAALEGELREAVQHKGFVLHFQAQVDRAGRLTGAEALLRLVRPGGEIVSPREFIKTAEETGLILPVGQWALTAACQQLAAWASQATLADLNLAVNISPRQFLSPHFVPDLLKLLDSTGLNPQRLKLELTESVLLDDVEDTIHKMHTLKARGIGFALDDFGTGYSSLSYLKRLPLDHLKIDQVFVKNLLVDTNDAAIARMIIVLADSMGLGVLAEGVESRAQKDCLDRLGCHAYQGFLFSEPLPLRQFEALAGQSRAAGLLMPW